MPLTNNQYVPAQWIEDNAPPISASELQAMSDAIRSVNNFATCTTAGATTEKEITIPGFSLVVGSRICVTFTNAWATSAAKLTIAGAAATYGPTPVCYAGSEALLSGIVPANYPVIFQYDGTAWNLINPFNAGGGVAVQSSEPDNTNMIWADTANGGILKYYDKTQSKWVVAPPQHTFSTVDLTEGESDLATGSLYFVYE